MRFLAIVSTLAQTATAPQHVGITQKLTEWAEAFIKAAGYLGAAILMALESMIAPVPSEAVMPFVGFAVHNGQMNLWAALAATSAGSVVGSLISYWLGYVGGKPLVMKVGRFLLLNEHHLDWTIAFFHKRSGTWTVFVCRFIPVVRHLISIPAGIGRMPLIPFLLSTFIGATLWNSLLLYLGYAWHSHLDEIKSYYNIIDKCVIVAFILGVIAWFWLHLKKKPASQKHEQATTEKHG